jgi:ADP-heptose:LPS heptosyltransferase
MDELGLDRVVLVRALKGLGDFLCVTPALRSLRHAYPESHLTLIGIESTRGLIARYGHLIDDFLAFPGFPGIPEEVLDVTRLPDFFATALGQRFDLAIQLHGNGSLMNPFTVMLGAQRSAGYHARSAYCPDPALYLPLDEDEHEVKRWLRLAEHIGAPPRGDSLEFPLLPEDWNALARLPEAVTLLRGRHVVIHPGATEPARRWLPAHFAAVADHFASAGWQVVLTGTADEAPIATEVERGMRWPAINLAGRTGLGAMAAMLSRARLLITNDTGVSHLGAALRVPSVVVFLASNPRRWAPLNRRLHRVVGRDGLQPDDVAPGQVLREASLLLALHRRLLESEAPVEAVWQEVARV